MDLQILDSPEAVARKAAGIIAACARDAIAVRGNFSMAVSGGRTPWVMLRELAAESLPWQKVHIFQIDERVAPAGDPDRNLTHLQASLLTHAPIPPENIHAMRVEESDLDSAASKYSETLKKFCGTPPVLDLAHLGMGPDGHCASLVPNDSVLNVNDRDVAMTAGAYQGRRRMTLTYPMINRSRKILWLITGADKASMLPRMLRGDTSIPAGRILQDRATVLADKAANPA